MQLHLSNLLLRESYSWGNIEGFQMKISQKMSTNCKTGEKKIKEIFVD